MYRLSKQGNAEILVKKSRFLGTAEAVDSKEEAASFLNQVRKRYYDARHVCYAWRIGSENPEVRFSDDGEPGGTAGKPILNVIQSQDVSDVMITVTRYFGGILLGTGGLSRAYRDAAAEALKDAAPHPVRRRSRVELVIPYPDYEVVQYQLSLLEARILETRYTEQVTITLLVSTEETEELIRSLREKTGGRVNARMIGEEIS